MTREEAIRRLEYLRMTLPLPQYAEEVIALETAISALMPPPNGPLTLEQLREMDGEPVWNDTMKKWVLVDLTWELGERTADAGGKWRNLDDRYYRRKPEEGERL